MQHANPSPGRAGVQRPELMNTSEDVLIVVA